MQGDMAMDITEVILSAEEFTLIQATLILRDKDTRIYREVKEAEGLKTLIENLNLLIWYNLCPTIPGDSSRLFVGKRFQASI